MPCKWRVSKIESFFDFFLPLYGARLDCVRKLFGGSKLWLHCQMTVGSTRLRVADRNRPFSFRRRGLSGKMKNWVERLELRPYVRNVQLGKTACRTRLIFASHMAYGVVPTKQNEGKCSLSWTAKPSPNISRWCWHPKMPRQILGRRGPAILRSSRLRVIPVLSNTAQIGSANFLVVFSASLISATVTPSGLSCNS